MLWRVQSKAGTSELLVTLKFQYIHDLVTLKFQYIHFLIVVPVWDPVFEQIAGVSQVSHSKTVAGSGSDSGRIPKLVTLKFKYIWMYLNFSVTSSSELPAFDCTTIGKLSKK